MICSSHRPLGVVSAFPVAPNSTAVRRRAGFTLVELLVVIGIIALLITVLMPALQKARNSAHAITCLSNLKTIGNAAQMYFVNNKGSFPVSYGLNANGITYNLNGNSEFAIHALHHALTGEWPASYTAVHKAFICDNMRDRIGDWETPPSKVSYGFNNGFGGWAQVAPGAKIPGLKLNHVQNPATKMYAMDWPYMSISQGFNNPVAAGAWYFVPGAGTNGSTGYTFPLSFPFPGYTYYYARDDYYNGRHGTKPGTGLTVNVLYVDGHAEVQSSRQMTQYFHFAGAGQTAAKRNPFNLILE